MRSARIGLAVSAAVVLRLRLHESASVRRRGVTIFMLVFWSLTSANYSKLQVLGRGIGFPGRFRGGSESSMGVLRAVLFHLFQFLALLRSQLPANLLARTFHDGRDAF